MRFKSKHPALRPVVCAAAFVLSGWLASAHAQTPPTPQDQSLVELFQAARSYDAGYLAAKAQAESVHYRAEQAKSLMRPSVGLRGTIDRARYEPKLDQTYPGVSSDAVNSTRKNIALSARQPLFNLANMADVDKGEQAEVAAAADLRSAEDDLIVRLTQAYFDVLAAKDLLATSDTNQKALSEQLAAAKRNFEVGNATITDTREAQARHDLATAQVIAAQNELKVRGLALDQLVGQVNVVPRPLLTPLNLPELAPGNAEEWTARIDQSPTVQKAAVGLEVARLETRKAKAGHYPTLDATAAVSHNNIDTKNNALAQLTGSSGTSGAVGLELNLPLFAGFAVQNRVKETLREEERAEHDLQNARRSVSLATRQAFFGVQSGMAQVKALEAAEGSAKLALEATQLGYRVGVRINKDVLDAQNMLANTQKDLYKARYDVLVATIRLRQASGTLKPEDLESFNQLLLLP